MSGPPSPSGEPRAAEAGIPALLIAVTAALLIVRLVAAAHVHLTEDEAYYRLWSMKPAFGYYDHPPMIAWWIWLGRRLLGDSSLGIRFVPILAVAATGLLVSDAARLAGAGREVALRAGLWFNAMALPLAGGFLAVPDSAASLFWLAALDCALRAVRRSSTPWWIAAGALCGLAALSKYSAFFLAPGILTWLSLVPEARAELRRPGPWLACLVAVSLFGFNVAWNAGHHWLTFHKQFGRIAAHQFAPRYLVEMALEQLVLMNPLIAVFAAAAIYVRKSMRQAIEGITPFVATSAPFAIYLVVHSLHDRVQAHWPAPIYPALSICAAATAQSLIARPVWRRLALAVPLFGWTLAVTAVLLATVPSTFGGRLSGVLAPIEGWPRFAQGIDDVRRRSGGAWIGTLSYGLAAQLASEPGMSVPIAQVAERDRWRASDAFGAPDFTKPGLIVDLPRRASVERLKTCFRRVDLLAYLPRPTSSGAGPIYTVLRVSGPRRDIAASGC